MAHQTNLSFIILEVKKMKQKILYQLSARQILVIALASAFIAAGTMACLSNYSNFWQSHNASNVAFAEDRPAGISDTTAVSDEQNNIEVYKTLSPGVAFINTTSYEQDMFGQVEEGKGTGSGSVIDAQGHILTNYHVIEGAQRVTVKLSGEKIYPAKVVGGDPDTDLAVIKIEPPREGLTVIPFGDSEKLIVGQKVLAIGNPFGLDRTLTTGIISGLQRPIRARNNRPIDAAIQTDASINPGNSGGPLLDKNGRLIGINSQILSPAGGSVGVGFAVPVSTAKRVVPALIQYGEFRRPRLGAGVRSISELVENGYRMPVENGLLVLSVIQGGTAERGGLRGLSESASGDVVLGDIIISLGGEKMTDQDDLYRFLDKKQIGETVDAVVYRSGKNVPLSIKLLGSSQQTTRQTRRF